MIGQRSLLCLAIDVCFGAAKGLPLADVLPHELSNHRRSNCVNDAGLADGAVG